ncbi:MAG: YHS domain-containing (seleno)protein [Paracoccaceae bacterium]|nr:YHS domain-containing (seleno)protein [Paracoccaceae bacterium]
MPNRRAVLRLAAAAPFASLAMPAFAMTPEIYAEDGIAIDGTDAVAYFTEERPVPGSEAHIVDWRGATWRFSSVETKAMFEADPEAYAPQYGGYCAYAVSRGYTASTVPQAWTIHDGKLYLNFSRPVRALWARDIPGNVRKGDENWPTVLSA